MATLKEDPALGQFLFRQFVSLPKLKIRLSIDGGITQSLLITYLTTFPSDK